MAFPPRHHPYGSIVQGGLIPASGTDGFLHGPSGPPPPGPAAWIDSIGASHAGGGVGGTPLTCDYPPTTADGDLLIMLIGANVASAFFTQGVTDNWVGVAFSEQNGGAQVYVYSKLWVTGDDDHTDITMSGINFRGNACIHQFRGVSGIDDFNLVKGDATSVDSGSIDTTVTTLPVVVAGMTGVGSTLTADGLWVPQTEVTSIGIGTGTSGDMTGRVFTLDATAAGNIDGPTVTRGAITSGVVTAILLGLTII